MSLLKSMTLIWVFFSLSISLGIAQPIHCGLDDINREAISSVSGFKERLLNTDKRLEILARNINSISPRNERTLTVVVHVVYNDAHENISDIQIKSQIAALNRDFACMDVSSDIPAEFSKSFEDTGIRFCLATVDPSGNPSNGITRNFTDIQQIGLKKDEQGRRLVHYGRKGGADGWNPDQYINIWVCNITNYLGYATRPGQAPHAEEDGLVIDYRYFGTQGTVFPPHIEGRTAVHEMGHYLGLLHIWGQNIGDCGDDLIMDTPPQDGPKYYCPIYPVQSCNTNNMTMNFMDYTDDPCMYLFTKGQGAFMRAVLVDQRAGLLSGNGSTCSEQSGKTLEDRLHLAPSVISGEILISMTDPGNEILEFHLFNSGNRWVCSYKQLASENMSLPLNHYLPPGFYFLQVKTSLDQTTFRLIII